MKLKDIILITIAVAVIFLMIGVCGGVELGNINIFVGAILLLLGAAIVWLINKVVS